MTTFLKVFAFNVVIIAFFLYVGNSIPQLRQDPPQELVLAADAPAEDFVKAGQDIFLWQGDLRPVSRDWQERRALSRSGRRGGTRGDAY